jgi:hypothetical protein
MLEVSEDLVMGLDNLPAGKEAMMKFRASQQHLAAAEQLE